MKNLLAIVLVAFMAITISYAQAGLPGDKTGTVEVTVKFMNIQVTGENAYSVDVYPGASTTPQLLTWNAAGSPGESIGVLISILNPTAATYLTPALNNPGGTTAFDATGNVQLQSTFTAACSANNTAVMDAKTTFNIKCAVSYN